MKRQRFSKQQWRRFIEQQRASGLGVQAFCRRHRLAPSTFFRWQRELGVVRRPARRPGAGTPATRARTRGANGRRQAGDGAGFVELLTGADRSSVARVAGAPLELVLANGLVVRVPPGFDPATLRQVLEALS